MSCYNSFLPFNVLGNDRTNSSEDVPVCGHLSLHSRDDSEDQEGHENVGWFIRNIHCHFYYSPWFGKVLIAGLILTLLLRSYFL